MMIDCFASLGHWPFRPLADHDALNFVRLMDRHGVDQAWVAPLQGLFYRHLAAANRELLHQTAGYRDRLRPWAVLNPAAPGWADDLRQAVEAGCAGLRLHPNYHGYDLTHQALGELLTAAQAGGLPVAIVQRLQDERLQSPLCQVPPVTMELAPLVARFPQLTLLCLGVTSPFITACRDLITTSSVYLDISRLEGVEGVRWAIDQVGADKILLGSHAPFFYLSAALLKLKESDLTAAELRQITSSNAQALITSPGARAGL